MSPWGPLLLKPPQVYLSQGQICSRAVTGSSHPRGEKSSWSFLYINICSQTRGRLCLFPCSEALGSLTWKFSRQHTFHLWLSPLPTESSATQVGLELLFCFHFPSTGIAVIYHQAWFLFSFPNHLFIFYMHYMCCTCVIAHVCRLEVKLWGLVLLSTRVPGVTTGAVARLAIPTCAFPAPCEAQRDRKLGETYYLLIHRDRVVL